MVLPKVIDISKLNLKTGNAAIVAVKSVEDLKPVDFNKQNEDDQEKEKKAKKKRANKKKNKKESKPEEEKLASSNPANLNLDFLDSSGRPKNKNVGKL